MYIAPYWILFIAGAALVTALIKKSRLDAPSRALLHGVVWGVLAAPGLAVGEGGAYLGPALVVLLAMGDGVLMAFLSMVVVVLVVFGGCLLLGGARRAKQ